MSSTSTASAAKDAWLLLFDLFSAHRAKIVAAAAAHDLSPMQVFALRHLEPGKPQPMSALAGFLACDASNVTGIVDRLESRGLVERRVDPNDRRVKQLVVTTTGEALRTEFLETLHEPPAALASLSLDDQRALVALLRRALR
jgi:DNA-binding MarR family transcriptional regulator